MNLAPDRPLVHQRVTVLVRDAPLEQTAENLVRLLSPSREAGVFWRGGGQKWTLCEDLNRRALAERLRNRDLTLFGAHLEAESEWARKEGAEALKKAGFGPAQSAMLERYAVAGALDHLGPEARATLLQGRPRVLRIGDLPDALRERWRQYLAQRSPPRGGLPQAEVDAHSFALVLSRNRREEKGCRIVLSLIEPGGRCWTRSTFLSQPGRAIPPLFGFTLRRPEPQDSSPRINLELPRGNDGRETVLLNLNDWLKLLHVQTGLNFVADGYLRPAYPFPAGLQAKDYPVGIILDRLCRMWGLQWQFTGEDRRTVLLRSTSWWMEDEADIPDLQLKEVLRPFQTGKGATPEMMFPLLNLTEPQVSKLLDLEMLPLSSSPSLRGMEDGTGLKPLLALYRALPPELRERARTEVGLPLSALPEALVEEHLGVLLTTFGAETQEQRRGMVFSLVPLAAGDAGGFRVSLLSTAPRGPAWTMVVRRRGEVG